jgi:hypothetical protein
LSNGNVCPTPIFGWPKILLTWHYLF